MRFRKAEKKDSEMLLRWRNDPATRANSLNTAEVKHEEHEVWLEKTLKNSGRILFIAEENGIPVGTMRADKLENEDGYELSWAVALEHRGKGMGKKILVQSVGEINSPVLKAKIKKENIASIKMAEYAGFSQDGEENGVLIWTLRR
mgnify:CR=1 FL=1